MKMQSCPFCRTKLPNHDPRCNFSPGRPGNAQRKQHTLLKQTINTNISQANVPKIDSVTRKVK